MHNLPISLATPRRVSYLKRLQWQLQRRLQRPPKWSVPVLIALLLVLSGEVAAQQYPERRNIRAGNRFYQQQNYPQAELAYRRALEKSVTSLEGQYNLAGALYQQERYEEAQGILSPLLQDSLSMPTTALMHYNYGNALFKQRKLEQAIEAYKKSLRCNPEDQEAKFNLAYAQQLLREQEQEQQQDQNQDQKEQDQKQDQNQDPKEQNQDQQGQGNQQEQHEQPQQGMSEAETQNILNAMQNADDNTKKKVDAQQQKVVGRSGKNW